MKKIVLLSAMLAFGSLQATEIAIKASSLKFDYTEKSQGVILDTESSNFQDILGLELELRNGWRNRYNHTIINDARFLYAKGDSKYVGAYLNDPSSNYGDVVDTTKNRLIELDYKFGWLFPVGSYSKIGAYAGLGGRLWDRTLADGNKETYYWGNGLLGARADVEVIRGGTVSITTEYQKALNPLMHTSSLDATFDLGKTDGYKIGLHWLGGITKTITFEMDWIYDVWNIGKSNLIPATGGGYYFEPDSKTKNQYIKMGFAFEF